MENTLFQNTVMVFFSLVLMACQTDPAIKTFADKNLPASHYAKLESPSGILILEIDGKELDYATQYHILPGKHLLHVMVSAFKEDRAYKVGDIDIELYATAEHTYQIKSLVTPVNENNNSSNKSNEFLWIEDTTLDSVVAGKKP